MSDIKSSIRNALDYIQYVMFTASEKEKQISHYGGSGYQRDIVCPHCKEVNKYNKVKYEEQCKRCEKRFTVIDKHGLTVYRKRGDTLMLRRDGMNVECMTEAEIHKLNEVKSVINDE